MSEHTHTLEVTKCTDEKETEAAVKQARPRDTLRLRFKSIHRTKFWEYVTDACNTQKKEFMQWKK